MNPKGYVDLRSKIIGGLPLQVEFAIGYVFAVAGIIGLILSVLLLIALAIPLKGSTRSCLYAAGSVISFLFGGTIGWFETFGPPGIGGMVYYIGVHNIVGVLFGYLFLLLAISRYKRDRELLPSMEPN